jgi:hypothetical protein
MIPITRRQARCLRGVFRRSVLGLTQRGAGPRLSFRAEGGQLRTHSRYGVLAIEHVSRCDPACAGIVVVPLDALAEFEGRDESVVHLETVAPEHTVARWVDRGIPQVREFAVPALDAPGPMPSLPGLWSTVSIGLLDALAEATATACDESTRYALGCVMLKGGAGEVVATDGHQLLVQGGYNLPWSGDVLIPRSRVFASRALPRDQPLEIGKTATHVVLRSGPWTIFCEIQTEGRFPRVEGAIPGAGMPATRLRLDPADVRFLLPALDRLPGRDELNAPATLDLNGCVAVRARGEDQPQVTELVLTRSGYDGPQVRLNTNRVFFSRALRLGFTAIEVSAPETPLVCRDALRTYAWQPLSKHSAIAPGEAVTRIDSSQWTTTEPAREDRRTQLKARTPLNEPRTSNGRAGHNGDMPTHPTSTQIPTPDGLAALIREAEALHEVLSDARTRTSRLVVALRRHRKRERLVSTTLAALQGLKLPEVVA